MAKLDVKVIVVILIHAFIGWALCGATMFVGMETLSMQAALIVHAVAAPVFFTIISLVYFKKFNFTKPLQTGIIFVGFVILMDFFVVAMLIEGSFEMFASPLGTWIPFALIFLSIYLTGLWVGKSE